VDSHATQLAPQWSLVLHAVHTFALHHCPDPQSPSTLQSTHIVEPALHTSPLAVQFAQDEPQCALSLHSTHTPSLHQVPPAQSRVTVHSRQTPPLQPCAQGNVVAGYEHTPWLQVPSALYCWSVVELAQWLAGGVVQVTPTHGLPSQLPCSQPNSQSCSCVVYEHTPSVHVPVAA
jgi:hypothetical protein